jgi:hypothetical protein
MPLPEIKITLDAKGGIQVSSNVDDRIVLFGLLDEAHHTLRKHFDKLDQPLVQPVQPQAPLDLIRGKG